MSSLFVSSSVSSAWAISVAILNLFLSRYFLHNDLSVIMCMVSFPVARSDSFVVVCGLVYMVTLYSQVFVVSSLYSVFVFSLMMYSIPISLVSAAVISPFSVSIVMFILGSTYVNEL